MSTKRIAFSVSGRVQGVFFRDTTEKRANSMGSTGFVTNARDGTVQGEAQGKSEAIDDFVHFLHQGPSAAKVTDVKQTDIATKPGEDDFQVQ